MAEHIYTLGDDPTTEHVHQASGIDYDTELNPEQLAAVRNPGGHCLVIAGAGSGKTRTLTYRVAWLLDQGVDPAHILLLTFTNKASREMLGRVAELVPFDLRRLWGGTFHSICNRILRIHAESLGFEKSFTILDREDQLDMISAALGESGINTKEIRFPKGAVLAEIFSLSVNSGHTTERIIYEQFPYFSELTGPIEDLKRRYFKKKIKTNLMDFDDLLIHVVRLFRKNPDIAEIYQQKFCHILVDEYQDTNPLQSRLVDIFAQGHGNLMVVGDDAQSIYSWRGADVRHIIDFPQRYPDTNIHKIETNYRSVPEILRLANAAISHNTEQFTKNLRSIRRTTSVCPAIVTLQDPSNQATFIAQRILELLDEGAQLNDIAVLYRAHYNSMEIQMEFTRRGIPFYITSGLRFFEQAHIKDVTAYMKLAANPRDEVAFLRLSRMLPGIGAKTASKLYTQWQKEIHLRAGDDHALLPRLNPSEIFAHLKPIPAKAKSHWQQLGYTLDEMYDDHHELRSPRELIISAMEGPYDEFLKEKYADYDRRKQDINQLVEFSSQFRDTQEFLSQLALLTNLDSDTSRRTRAQEDDAVCLSTVHQAKGLEWRTVFVVWLSQGIFPNAKAIEAREDALAEERRLFYVAITRARDELYLTRPILNPNSRTGDFLQKPSQFLNELPPDLTDTWKVQR